MLLNPQKSNLRNEKDVHVIILKIKKNSQVTRRKIRSKEWMFNHFHVFVQEVRLYYLLNEKIHCYGNS